MQVKEILKMAMEYEKKSADRYLEYAGLAEDVDARILFEQLAREEESHYRLLQTRLNAYKLLES